MYRVTLFFFIPPCVPRFLFCCCLYLSSSVVCSLLPFIDLLFMSSRFHLLLFSIPTILHFSLSILRLPVHLFSLSCSTFFYLHHSSLFHSQIYVFLFTCSHLSLSLFSILFYPHHRSLFNLLSTFSCLPVFTSVSSVLCYPHHPSLFHSFIYIFLPTCFHLSLLFSSIPVSFTSLSCLHLHVLLFSFYTFYQAYSSTPSCP